MNNSIMTRVQEKNSSVYFMGCPCHVVHNAAGKASDKFAEVSSVLYLCHDYN